MERKILIAYENKQYPVEMDISERSELEVKKIKEILRRVGRTWQIEKRKEKCHEKTIGCIIL